MLAARGLELAVAGGECLAPGRVISLYDAPGARGMRRGRACPASGSRRGHSAATFRGVGEPMKLIPLQIKAIGSFTNYDRNFVIGSRLPLLFQLSTY